MPRNLLLECLIQSFVCQQISIPHLKTFPKLRCEDSLLYSFPEDLLFLSFILSLEIHLLSAV